MTEHYAYPPNEAFEANRKPVHVDIGAIVEHNKSAYRITQILDFEAVIGVNLETGRSVPLSIKELRCLEDGQSIPIHGAASVDLDEIADADWQVAQKRFAAISPLVGKLQIGRRDTEERAKEVGVDVATLYRWLKRYNAYETVTALIPMKRGWKTGKSRISVEVEAVVNAVISDFYLTLQRPTPKQTIDEVERRCRALNLEPPAQMTVRKRIRDIPERERLRARGYRERADNKYTPTPGKFPNADFPLAVVQIDHTLVDIILVDDVSRKPIGRPWITLAMDVYSRKVTGYYLSFDPPSETSVAMCVASSILPKDEWLLLHKVDADWPVWGKPQTIHVDNGADFRSNNFQRSCLAHGINLEFRPVKRPRYGGHIERLLGTLLKEIHALPGTTFSSVKDREGYDSEKHAALTKSEFETWLVTLICKIYHQRLHKGIGMSPARQWEIGILGNGDITGVGVPPRPADGLTILLDFLPCFRRTVQTTGITLDNMSYYAEALRPWIGARDPDTGKARKFVFRRDPRDISCLWFFDPELKQYFRIPFSDQTLPSMSIWEYRQARDRLQREGRDSVNEREIAHAVEELRAHVDEAQKRSKAARRQAQRRREHEKGVSPATPVPKKPDAAAAPTSKVSTGLEDLLDDDVDTYGDIA